MHTYMFYLFIIPFHVLQYNSAMAIVSSLLVVFFPFDHFAVDTSIEDFGPVTIASYFYSFTPFSCFIDNKG